VTAGLLLHAQIVTVTCANGYCYMRSDIREALIYQRFRDAVFPITFYNVLIYAAAHPRLWALGLAGTGQQGRSPGARKGLTWTEGMH